MSIPGRPQGPFSAWAKVRAALIGFALLVNFVAALQLPGPVTEESVKKEASQREIKGWKAFLDDVGIEYTTEEIEDIAVYWGSKPRSWRNTVMKPFKPWFNYTGTRQGWGLFAYPDHRPYKLRISLFRSSDGRFDDKTVLYESHSEHQWKADLLHFRRVRALYNPGSKRPKKWKPWARWMAGHAFREFPDHDRFEVQAIRLRTMLPWEEPDTSAQTRFTYVVRREDLFGEAP